MRILDPKFGIGFVVTMQGGPKKPYPYRFGHPALLSFDKFAMDMLTTNMASNALFPSQKTQVLSI